MQRDDDVKPDRGRRTSCQTELSGLDGRVTLAREGKTDCHFCVDLMCLLAKPNQQDDKLAYNPDSCDAQR